MKYNESEFKRIPVFMPEVPFPGSKHNAEMMQDRFVPEAVPVTKTILLTGYRAKIIRLRPTDVIIDRAGRR
jgi:hypothetical protein